jgi:hypothetical protein
MKNYYLTGIAITILCNLANAQIQMNSAGKVGINATPESGYNLVVGSTTYPAYVKLYNLGSAGGLIIDNSVYQKMALYPYVNSGSCLGKSGYAFSDIWYYTPHQVSDKRQKENIRDITNPLIKILRLKGVEYDLKKEYFYIQSVNYGDKTIEKLEKDRKNRLGFLAQDVENVVPEAVFYDDSLDSYSMDYSRIIPVLVEAIKEQQSQIDSLKKLIKKNLSNLKSAELGSEVKEINRQEDLPTLEQNFPNPFTSATTINLYVPQSNHTAAVYIYDLQGMQKKAYNITAKGKSSINISGYELQAGMYMYTLIVDGKEVDTKKMILTE